MVFLHSLQSEWLKTKRSTTSWLCIIGGFLLPTVQFIAFLVKHYSINDYPVAIGIWQIHYNYLVQNLVMFLLPMGVVLAASLLTQLEFKNNTWKQVHTTPQTYTTVFFAKLSGIAAMTVLFFIYFNIGVIVSGYLSTIIVDGEMPKQAFPLWLAIKANGKIFITCLPIIAIQYLISLRFKNFIVPVGIGFVALITTLILTPVWHYAYFSPYSFCMMNVMVEPRNNVPINMYAAAGISFVVITAANYLIYINRKEKG